MSRCSNSCGNRGCGGNNYGGGSQSCSTTTYVPLTVSMNVAAERAENFEVEGEKEKDFSCCDSKSACALKEIIDLLDCLNEKDLRVLDALLDRIICCRC